MQHTSHARLVDLGNPDPLFARIRAEAEEATRREPELSSFMYAKVLNHGSLEAAVAHRVATRLDHRDLNAEMILHAFIDLFHRGASLRDAGARGKAAGGR